MKGDEILKRTDYKSFDDLPLMLSVQELSILLGVSRTSAYELSKEKGFPSVKIRGRIVIPKEQFIKWIEMQAEKGGAR